MYAAASLKNRTGREDWVFVGYFKPSNFRNTTRLIDLLPNQNIELKRQHIHGSNNLGREIIIISKFFNQWFWFCWFCFWFLYFPPSSLIIEVNLHC
jgi:hypothetical protein